MGGIMLSLALLTEQVTLSKESIASGWWSAQFASFTPQDVALVLLFSLIASLIILTVHRRTFKGVIYNPTFGTTLILLTLVTGPVVMAIGSNVALSMGMVGALSIVRFRTPVKEPVDTAYMFWAITMGIIIGTKSYVIAMGVVIGISIIMLGLSMFRSRASENYLLVLHYDPAAEQEIDAELHRGVRAYRVRSKTITRSGAEMTVDMRLNQRTDIVSHMLDISGVHDATLVSCQNESAV